MKALPNRRPITPVLSEDAWLRGPRITAAQRRDAGPTTLPTPLDLLGGVEVNELESETLFDTLFGPKLPSPPSPPKR